MLCCDCCRGAIESSENDASMQLSCTHIVEFGCAVDDVVDGLQGEVHGHKFYDGSQSHKGSSTSDTCEASFGDGSVPDSFGTVFVDEAFGDFVCSVVIGDFLAHHEHFWVSGKFFVESSVEGFSDSYFFSKRSE
jgi:hypothetical protein